MAKTSLHISIPEPCHEDWSKMTPTQCGAFCKACQKEVVDFSQMSEAEIVERLSKASGKVCGRIAADKLDRELVKYDPDHAWYSWKKWAVAAGVLLGAGSSKANNLTIEKSAEQDTSIINQSRLKGITTDLGGIAIPNVRLSIMNAPEISYSDSAGNFVIDIPSIGAVDTSVILEAYKHGFVLMTQSIHSNTDTLISFKMEPDIPIEMLFTGQIVQTHPKRDKARHFFRRIAYAFRKPARR